MAVAVRVSVVIGLAIGPLAPSDADLDGWDVARFADIARGVNGAVEYPPGTVAIVRVLGGTGPAELLWRVALVALIADLALATVLSRTWGARLGVRYLVVSTPLIGLAYVRLDLLATLAAVAALAAGTQGRALGAGLCAGAGLAVKTFPPAVAVALVTPGRLREAAAVVGGAVVALGCWVALDGVDGVRQVLTFREATGWHLSSTGGLVTSLFGDGVVRKEAGSFRIGEVSSVARVVGVVAVAGVGLVAARRRWRSAAPGAEALAVVAVLCALVVTSPLFSPQFVLWTVPFALVAGAAGHRCVEWVVLGSAWLTVVVMAFAGPSEVHEVLPATSLLVRNLALAAAVIEALRQLRPSSPDAPSAPALQDVAVWAASPDPAPPRQDRGS